MHQIKMFSHIQLTPPDLKSYTYELLREKFENKYLKVSYSYFFKRLINPSLVAKYKHNKKKKL